MSDAKDQITINNVESGFKCFHTAKSALNKAKRRINAPNPGNYLNEGNRINKAATIIIPTENLSEKEDHFLIYESPTGSVVLGTKFLITQFFKSHIALSDGTFKIALNGYAQTYILWYIVEGTVENETVPRRKAIAAVYFLMKTKSKEEYEELFGALELYR